LSFVAFLPMPLGVVASAIVAAAAAAAVAARVSPVVVDAPPSATLVGLRPLNPVNLTVYHVAEANYSSNISNMNTGDPNGDAEFMIRAAGLAYLCGPDSGEANYTFDCSDVEQSGTDLVVSKVIVEADQDFSECVVVVISRYSCWMVLVLFSAALVRAIGTARSLQFLL
jgi:hypothetical protein